MIKHIKDVVQGKASIKDHRSYKWNKVRKDHLAQNPNCAVCSGSKKIEVHHIKPFNAYPKLELDTKNLITLCENKSNGVNCHLFFGHLGNYKTINTKVIEDSQIWRNKMMNKKTK